MELFRSMTVRENVEIAAEAAHIGNDPFTQLGLVRHARRQRHATRERAGEILDRVGITSIGGTIAGRVSTGQGRMVELARALATEPRILLLDEPSSGLDAAETKRFGEILRRIVTDTGAGILLVEHDMALVMEVCQYLYVIDFGRPIFEGTPSEVASSDIVRAAYLGTEAVEVA
jgi:ABC-type branched-subunit amino acid transport system ATPase component